VSLPSVEKAARAALATLLAPSVKNKIWAGEYVALETLHKVDDKNPTFTWDNNRLSISTPKSSKPDSIFAWIRLFNTYAVVVKKKLRSGPRFSLIKHEFSSSEDTVQRSQSSLHLSALGDASLGNYT
jgi:hypothetical protein